jgi:hypothetical protein
MGGDSIQGSGGRFVNANRMNERDNVEDDAGVEAEGDEEYGGGMVHCAVCLWNGVFFVLEVLKVLEA